MATRFRWAQYAMISGRVQASSTTRTNFSVPPQVTNDGQRTERQSLNLNPEGANIEYELTAPEGHLLLVLHDSANLKVRRDSLDGKYVLKFEQRAQEPLTLSLANGDRAGKLGGRQFLALVSGRRPRSRII